MDTWRKYAAPVVAAALRETKGQPEGVIRKALFDAYPFGSRANHPYKIWLDEIRKQRGIPSAKARRDQIEYDLHMAAQREQFAAAAAGSLFTEED